MFKIFKKAFNLFKDFSYYFYRGWRAHLFLSCLKNFVKESVDHLNELRRSLQYYRIEEDKIEKLHQLSLGLYSLLPPDARFSYSILIPLTNPNPAFFLKCLESILNQNIPSLEILVGYTQGSSLQIKEIISRFALKIRIFDESRAPDETTVINRLAEKSSGHFILAMGQEDWLRPDFIFRYEQTLRLFLNPEERVLYCDLNLLNDQNTIFSFKRYDQPAELQFPFLFENFLAKGLLISKELWKKIKGFDVQQEGAFDEDLLLRLDLAGAKFQHIPLELYFVRNDPRQERAKKSQNAFIKALENYSKTKELDWKWLPGFQSDTVRALPSLSKHHSIHVIIPFKDQKELTLKCVSSVLRQKHVDIKMTTIDNRSADLTIAKAISSMGGEVLSINEPFNYSRLNNLAVRDSIFSGQCDILLFLNNDVELETEAVCEMLRWIDEPQVGMVGCRLNYPDGRLQHGGIVLAKENSQNMHWDHIEKFRLFDQMTRTKKLGFFDAVTCACAMIKRQTFVEVGGFDEIWYPVAYSDTHLAVKIKSLGLRCFYTPYAVGVHYESVSRKSSLEDFEHSWWLHQLIDETHPRPECLF